MVGNGSSYVAKGVVKWTPFTKGLLGGPGNEFEPPRLCNLAWVRADGFAALERSDSEVEAPYEDMSPVIVGRDAVQYAFSKEVGEVSCRLSWRERVEPERRRVESVSLMGAELPLLLANVVEVDGKGWLLQPALRW